MCKLRMQTDELLDMLSSIILKKSKMRGNLRLEVLLESTHKWLYEELKEKQLNRKRKWEEIKTDLKKSRLEMELDSMEVDSCEDILACGSHDSTTASTPIPEVHGPWNQQ